ncbi:carboxylating nicotinate-nucleotide diphosphorylase [Thermospira aquatica]|uniref:Probable nicotinate-nucleotide pyrophosphorylase [carboxylating] n=1 Tax=Thermospira aquatica TaxID=2828656 RepID=A0AAX3BCF1_9SPIR|nr:carboxylating nicotinate-nucleotide diphosphorylase [Thermospira aquatica]URA09951.1 carboxylating nicotinate-nucleotide diphosphorylase [Thermospira aquatica]
MKKHFPFRLKELNAVLIDEAVQKALREDFGEEGDITSLATLGEVPVNKKAAIIAKEEGMVCGLEVVQHTFSTVDAQLKMEVFYKDGAWVTPGTVLVKLEGAAQSILRGERVALNFLGLMSGIATKTHRLVQSLDGTSIKILDTRKTLPGLRVFEKYAVAVGGGYNHRYGLYDMILIKENHRAAAGGITEAVKRAYSLYPEKLIEVEVSTLEEVREALATPADILMLDNMTDEMIREAVRVIAGRKMVEASGNMTEERVIKLARMGVDFVSMGALTHTVKPLDVSLLMEDFL